MPTVTWTPNDGSGNFPPDETAKFGTIPATPNNPTLAEVNASSDENQLVAETHRRALEAYGSGSNPPLNPVYYDGALPRRGATWQTFRQKIDKVRAYKLLSLFPWTIVLPYAGKIRQIVDKNEMRQALNNLAVPANGIWFGGFNKSPSMDAGDAVGLLSNDAAGVTWIGGIGSSSSIRTPLLLITASRALGRQGFASLNMQSWTPYNGAASMAASPVNFSQMPVTCLSGRLVAHTGSQSIAYSDDGGVNWTLVGPISFTGLSPAGHPWSTSVHLTRVYLAAANRLVISGIAQDTNFFFYFASFYSDDEGVTWSQSNFVTTTLISPTGGAIIYDGGGAGIYAIVDYFFTGGVGDRFNSVDNGATWAKVGLNTIQIRNSNAVRLTSGRILVTNNPANLGLPTTVYSDDNFATMTTLAAKFSNVCVVGNDVYALARPDQTTSGFFEIWKSTDECATFTLYATTNIASTVFSAGSFIAWFLRADRRLQ